MLLWTNIKYNTDIKVPSLKPECNFVCGFVPSWFLPLHFSLSCSNIKSCAWIINSEWGFQFWCKLLLFRPHMTVAVCWILKWTQQSSSLRRATSEREWEREQRQRSVAQFVVAFAVVAVVFVTFRCDLSRQTRRLWNKRDGCWRQIAWRFPYKEGGGRREREHWSASEAMQL